MTTTSAGNGASADDSGSGESGDWGWFTPAKAKGETEGEGGTGAGERERERERDGGEIPSRPVSAIRPVGSGAERARRAPGPEQGAGTGTGTPGPASASADVPLPTGAPASATGPHAPEPPARRVPEQSRGQASPEHSRAAEGRAPRAQAAAHAPAQALESTPVPAQASGSASASAPAPAPAPARDATEAQRPGQAPPPAQPSVPLPRAASSTDGPAASATNAATNADVREPSRDALLIRRTMDEIEPSADAVTAYFYALLFVQHPQLRDLFPASMDTQRDRLFRALLTAVKLVDDIDTLTEYLSHLGRGHRKYGTRAEHYPAVGECLLGALSQYATRTWDDETEGAWVRAYTTISQVMIDAAADDEHRAPAWWNAEVVSHEQRTPQIAVLTVRPDQPYPFLAGQYTSVETPWWPRVWRHYSFASSPRADGLLTFHVKAVPAGWVSSALVHRARPGDVIRLGPPGGTMTVDHASDSGLLCLGGGTGIAPIKALIEDVAQHGRARPVEVFYGARSDYDLYDLDTMIRLEKQHRWLSVRPVISDGRAGPSSARSLAGQLPDAVRQYGPWGSYDGYLSGPPGMIRSGVDALVGAGIPTHRIRHDSLDELVATAD
ncbi:globin domain-containing protein [Streptomyces daliensis]